MKRRRTWRLQLAAEWLSGTSFGILGIRNRHRPGETETIVRGVLRTYAGRAAASRLSRRYRRESR